MLQFYSALHYILFSLADYDSATLLSMLTLFIFRISKCMSRRRESLSTFVLPCVQCEWPPFAKIYIYLKRWSTMYLMLWLYCLHPARFLLFVVYLSHPCLLPAPPTVTFTARIYLCLSRDTGLKIRVALSRAFETRVSWKDWRLTKFAEHYEKLS